MLRLRAIVYWALGILLLSGGAGCFPGGNHPMDEETDAHFQRGRELTDAKDFKGAAMEFEKALEDNPHSAAAHFELGWLYDTKLNDYAAAIYHYERHLLYKPDSKRAILVKERIKGCKEELANTEFPLPNSADLQRQVDRLTAENQQLKKQLDDAKNHPVPELAPVQNVVDATMHGPAPIPEARGRVHVVRAHETISSIAAEYRLKTSALLAANPHINPRRLRVGQSLNLP